MKRQIETLESGGEVAMETRKFAWQKGVTHALRNKETGKDYRWVWWCSVLLKTVFRP